MKGKGGREKAITLTPSMKQLGPVEPMNLCPKAEEEMKSMGADKK